MLKEAAILIYLLHSIFCLHSLNIFLEMSVMQTLYNNKNVMGYKKSFLYNKE